MVRSGAVLIALILTATSAAAAVPSAPVQFQADEVAAWCDSVFVPMFEQRRFSGLAVVLVQDGAVLVNKTYGYADLARQTPLRPDRTRLRIGSVTKSMTATLILQLLDEGRIQSLDDPANVYLHRFKLPDHDGKSVTLRHLLTHRGGFEARLLGLGTERATRAPADAMYIRQVMPQQVRAPGGQPIYSNFDFEVLGAIVEDVTGQTMAAALEQRLFRPLGMNNSALPRHLRSSADLGQPYAQFPNGELQAVPYVPLHPFAAAAGGVEATPDDMARYMMAQLDEQGSADRPILAPRWLREMHRRQAGANVTVTGAGLGVFVSDRSGLRIVEHPGHWPGFHSLMTLIPEWNAGLFISGMAQPPVPTFAESLWGSPRLRAVNAHAIEPALDLVTLYEVREAFMTHFARASTHIPVMIDARPMIGRYRSADRSHTTPEAILGLLGGGLIVRLAAPNAITVDGSVPYAAIAADSFARDPSSGAAIPRGVERYAFVRDADGRISYLLDSTGYGVSEPIGALQSPLLWKRYVEVTALLCLTGVVLIRRRSRSPGVRILPWLPLGLVLCLGAQIGVLFVGYGSGRDFIFDLLTGRSERLAALVVLGDVMVVLVLAMLFGAIRSWGRHAGAAGIWGLAARLHFSIIAAAAAGLLPMLYLLNLVGIPALLH